MSAPDGSALLTDLRRLCESTKPDHTPVVYSLGQLRAMLNTPHAPIASWLDAPNRMGCWWITTPARPTPARPSLALVMINDLWRDDGTLRFAAYHFGTEDTSREDELPGARWFRAEPPAAPAEVIAHNPDRAQIALLGALTTEQVKRDPDPTAPGAPGERVERRG